MGAGMVASQSSRQRDTRVPRARRLRRDVTKAERRLWHHLRAMSIEGTHFRRQATIGPYFADFACHEKRLVIEVDGGQHGMDEGRAADDARTAFLDSHGYRVLRFWNNDVLGNIDGVMSVIMAAVRDTPMNRPPPPTPPHRSASLRGGRGEERQ